MTILLMVPSRGRPDAAAQAYESWQATTTGHSEFRLLLDSDDPELAGYLEGIPADVGPRIRAMPALNRCVRDNPGYAGYGFMGDDHRLRTPGWEDKVIEVLGDYGVVYGDDLAQRENLATAVFMGGELVRTLGWFVPPELIHLYADNAWMTIGKSLKTLTYLPDVVIEHLHPIFGKGEWDARYEEVNDPAMYERDRHAFETWLNTSARDELQRVYDRMHP